MASQALAPSSLPKRGGRFTPQDARPALVRFTRLSSMCALRLRPLCHHFPCRQLHLLPRRHRRQILRHRRHCLQCLQGLPVRLSLYL